MEKQGYKLPQLIVKKSYRGKSGCYLVTADLQHKEKKSIAGPEGSVIELLLPKSLCNNTKDRMPNECYVAAGFGDVCFPEGTKLFIDHFVMTDHEGGSNHIFEGDDGVKYWRIENHDVYAGVVDDKIVVNDDNLLCEYINGNKVHTDFDLRGDLVGDRQDAAVVAFSSDPRYPVGTIILVEDYSLYQIDFNGKKYAKVEIGSRDIIAVLKSDKVMKVKVINMNLSDL